MFKAESSGVRSPQQIEVRGAFSMPPQPQRFRFSAPVALWQPPYLDQGDRALHHTGALDLTVLHDRLPASTYTATFERDLNFQDQLGKLVNQYDKILLN